MGKRDKKAKGGSAWRWVGEVFFVLGEVVAPAYTVLLALVFIPLEIFTEKKRWKATRRKLRERRERRRSRRDDLT